MSRKSRRRNKVLAAMVGLAGASKLGLIGKMPTSVTGDKFATARKAMTSNKAMRGISKSMPIADTIAKGVSTIKTPRARSGQKAMGMGVGKSNIIEKVLNPNRRRSNRLGFQNRNMGGDVNVKTKLNGVTKTKTY